MTQWHATTGGARLCLRASPLLVVSFAWLHESEDLMIHPTYFVCDVFVHNRVFRFLFFGKLWLSSSSVTRVYIGVVFRPF